jgi:uncharacterized protein YndB with AHSA1/START domain
MTVQTIAPVRRQVTVEASQQTAFEVFTHGMASWWNPRHHIAEKPYVDLVLEARSGGRWFERDADGAECDWGEVLSWEPPARVVLGWHLDADFAYDKDLVTEVEIRFVAETPDVTRVELEHRDLERFGDRAEKVRDSLDSSGGWQGLLDLFEEKLASRG